jgi:hypothetical protein
MRFKVMLNVDGERFDEEVSARDAQLAIKEALKRHPTVVEGVIPLEEQLSIEPQDHPGQEAIPDAGMEAIGDAIAAEAGDDLELPPHPRHQEVVPPADLEDLDGDGGVWEDIGTAGATP